MENNDVQAILSRMDAIDTHLEATDGRITDLEGQQKEMRAVLSGDITGKPGAMTHLLNLMEVVYGPQENRNVGLQSRVEKIEQSDLKRAAWIAGAVFAGGGLLALAWKVIDVLAVIHGAK